MFNELSTAPVSVDKYSANDKMKLFSETIATARQNGFRNIRSHYDSHQIQLADNYTLYDWLISKDISEVLRNNLYGMLVLPFIRDDDEEVEAQYVEANYYFEDKDNGVAKTNCLGLAAAYLYETLSVSIQSSPAWTRNVLQITVEKDKGSETKKVNNVFSRECFVVADIRAVVENLGELNLVESPILPKDKKIHITAHHGQKELRALWSKLKNSPYVIEAMSIEWGGKRFIRRTSANGAIEIVDTDSDEGYALLVQTTATNLREADAIAEILRGRYE